MSYTFTGSLSSIVMFFYYAEQNCTCVVTDTLQWHFIPQWKGVFACKTPA